MRKFGPVLSNYGMGWKFVWAERSKITWLPSWVQQGIVTVGNFILCRVYGHYYTADHPDESWEVCCDCCKRRKVGE